MFVIPQIRSTMPMPRTPRAKRASGNWARGTNTTEQRAVTPHITERELKSHAYYKPQRVVQSTKVAHLQQTIQTVCIKDTLFQHPCCARSKVAELHPALSRLEATTRRMAHSYARRQLSHTASALPLPGEAIECQLIPGNANKVDA